MPVYTEDKVTSVASASYTIDTSNLIYDTVIDTGNSSIQSISIDNKGYVYYKDMSNLESNTACTNVKKENSIKKRKPEKSMEVDRIIFCDPATIVFWKDGTKTVVKCTKGTKFDKYAGFCAAVTKRVYENNSLVNKMVKNGYEEPKKGIKIPASKALKSNKDNKNVKKGAKN